MVLQLLQEMLDIPKMYYIAFLSIGFIVYYLHEVVQTPKLACADGPFRSFLEENVPLVKDKYWPTLWCIEPRLQTIFSHFIRTRIYPTIGYQREILALKDGGEIALDWAEQDCSQSSPIVLILPGLTGASESEYIRILVTSAKKVDIRCVIFNYRGLGGVELKTPRTYCACNCEDLIEVVEHVKKLHPHVPLGAVGISLGGVILGNYLAQQGKSARDVLKACLVISVPWDVFGATENIERPFLNLLINQHLTSALCRTLKNQSTKHDFSGVDVDAAIKSKTVREYDSQFTSKLFGFKNVDEYYSSATLHDKLHHIKVPLLCLTAADDPFQPLKVLPISEFSKSQNIALLMTNRGGHVAFLEGVWPMKEEQYIGKLFVQYFPAVLSSNIEKYV